MIKTFELLQYEIEWPFICYHIKEGLVGFFFRPGVSSRAERIQRCCADFKAKLEDLNRHKMAEVQDHLNTAVSNFVANVKYRFVDGHGPRIGKVSAKEPLMWKYDY